MGDRKHIHSRRYTSRRTVGRSHQLKVIDARILRVLMLKSCWLRKFSISKHKMFRILLKGPLFLKRKDIPQIASVETVLASSLMEWCSLHQSLTTRSQNSPQLIGICTLAA